MPTLTTHPEQSRRNLLRSASAAGIVLFLESPAFAASDFWNKKESSAWSEDEQEQLKTKSPWAKKIKAEMPGGGGAGRGAGGGGTESMDASGSKGSFGGMSGADSNGISAGGGGGRGGGGGGRGGRGGGGEGGGGGFTPQGPDVVVRWENAAPVLEATKLKLPADLAEHYAISVTGLPPQMLAVMLAGGGGRGRGRGREGAAAPAEVQPQEDPAARQKAMIDRLLQSATLTAKGRDPQTADIVRQAFGNQTLIFGFPKQSFPIAASDKDIQFVMKLGALSVKAKFEPKEMTY